jgi:hypothetical protein
VFHLRKHQLESHLTLGYILVLGEWEGGRRVFGRRQQIRLGHDENDGLARHDGGQARKKEKSEEGKIVFCSKSASALNDLSEDKTGNCRRSRQAPKDPDVHLDQEIIVLEASWQSIESALEACFTITPARVYMIVTSRQTGVAETVRSINRQ